MEGLRGLVAQAGGRERVLLVAEAGAAVGGSARGLLSGLSGALLGEVPGPAPGASPAALPGPGRRFPPCALVLVLLGARSLSLSRLRGAERRRLRELLRDVRGRLQPSLPGAPPALLAVAVLPPEPQRDAQELLLPVLEGLLREAFPERTRSGTLLRETLQAAAYLPGGGARGTPELPDAACRALRAALRIHAEGAEAQKVQRLPAFLRCIPWSRRSQKRKGHLGKAASGSNDDSLQDPEEGVALTSVAPNGEL